MNVDHLQPIESLTPHRGGAMRTWLAAAVPVVVLVGVVAAGVLGQAPVPKPDRAGFDGSSSVPPVPARTSADEMEEPIPAQVLGIETTDAEAVGRLAKAGVGSDRLLAVVGWLTLAPEGADCGAGASLCRRTGLVADVPTVDGGGALFLETRPDVTVTGTYRRRPRPDSWSVPSRAVVVGRFAPRIDRECGLRRPNCERVFTVELVAWLNGSEIAVTPAVDATGTAARTPDEITAIARSAIRGAGDVVGATLVEPSRLPSLEPDAAIVGIGRDGPVWLVRTVAFRAGQDTGYEPVSGWAVVDDETGEVLAAAPSRADGQGRRP